MGGTGGRGIGACNVPAELDGPVGGVPVMGSGRADDVTRALQRQTWRPSETKSCPQYSLQTASIIQKKHKIVTICMTILDRTFGRNTLSEIRGLELNLKMFKLDCLLEQ